MIAGSQERQTPVNLKLPMRPQKVELDPTLWVLSEKMSVQNTGH